MKNEWGKSGDGLFKMECADRLDGGGWLDWVRTLVIGCDIVLFDVTEIGTGLETELGEVRNLNALGKTLFIRCEEPGAHAGRKDSRDAAIADCQMWIYDESGNLRERDGFLGAVAALLASNRNRAG